MLQRAREIIASGELGELRAVTFERTASLTQTGKWRQDPQQGGAIFDVATHLLDLVPWLTGGCVTGKSARSPILIAEMENPMTRSPFSQGWATTAMPSFVQAAKYRTEKTISSSKAREACLRPRPCAGLTSTGFR
jgi:predicted dehydrogenase